MINSQSLGGNVVELHDRIKAGYGGFTPSKEKDVLSQQEYDKTWYTTGVDATEEYAQVKNYYWR